MLDTIRALMAEGLQISTKEVNDLRDELLREQATEDARYAATSALNHPAGSSTPINEAYSRAQVRADRLREKAIKEVPKALAALLAVEVAVQRRDEVKLHREMKAEGEAVRTETGLHTAAADWFARLAKHGVHPHYLKQHSNETVAIIADLVAWKAKDAKFDDPNNPWRALLGIYAARRIEKPDKVGKAKRSVPGTPKGPRHRGGSEDYRFDQMLSPVWGAMPAQVAPPPPPILPIVLQPTFVPADFAVRQSAETPPITQAPPSPTESSFPAEAVRSFGQAPVKPSDPPLLPADARSSVQPALTQAAAAVIAEKIYDSEKWRMEVLWPPKGVEQGDYDPSRLIPALEDWVNAGAGRTAQDFLAAARRGRAEDFMRDRRRRGTSLIVERLVEGDRTTWAAARRLGFDNITEET